MTSKEQPGEFRETGEAHLGRVRRICSSLPGTSEKLSHGEHAFFVGKKMFATFANNHHADGHIAVWLAAAPGVQEMLVATSPDIYFRPPYVGVRGWVGVELSNIDEDDLSTRVVESWNIARRGHRKSEA